MAYRASNVITVHIVLLVFSTLLTYGLAVRFGHIDAFVPYIGYIGDQPLESTVFTQFFVVAASVFMFVVQIQYVWASFFLNKNEASRESFLANTAGVFVGYASAIGLFFLACFQESHAYYVHHSGEFLYLFGSVLYFSLHTFIFRRRKDFRTTMRFLFSIFMVALFVIFLVGYVFAVKQFKKPWDQRYHWQRNDGGWLPYILSAVSEWLLIFLFQCYLLTFYTDFRQVMIARTRITVLLEERRLDGEY